MPVRDEKGRTWKVSGGDPASKPVNLCHRMGYDLVVLPANVLRYGDIGIMDYAAEPDEYIDRIRMLDCLEVLNG
jgi:hypothetical protein